MLFAYARNKVNSVDLICIIRQETKIWYKTSRLKCNV